MEEHINKVDTIYVYMLFSYIYTYTHTYIYIYMLFSVGDCVMKLCSQILVGGDDRGQQRSHICTAVPKTVDSKRGRSG